MTFSPRLMPASLTAFILMAGMNIQLYKNIIKDKMR